MVDLQETPTGDQPRKFQIPKFDKRLHEAKRNNWDVIFYLNCDTPYLVGQDSIQGAILDVDRFNILVQVTGRMEEVWISKSAIAVTHILS